MRTFFLTAALLSTFAFNFAYGMDDSSYEEREPEFYRDADYDMMETEPEVIRAIRAEALCKARYNRKLETNVWLCDTNPFYQYATEEACLSYCN